MAFPTKRSQGETPLLPNTNHTSIVTNEADCEQVDEEAGSYSAVIEPERPTTVYSQDNKQSFGIAAIDSAASEYNKTCPGQQQSLTIDLSKVTYLEHETLVHLGAIIKHRHSFHRKTLIHLPQSGKPSRDIVDFLSGWRFPEFLDALTGQTIDTFLDSESKELWFSSLQEPNPYVRAMPGPRNELVPLLPRSCFWLTAIPDLRAAADSAQKVKDRFLDTHFRSVLDSHLHNQGQRVAHSIYEAVLNAGVHSQATQAFISSQFRWESPLDHSSPGYLEISIWDNGIPFYSSLRRTARKLGYITTGSFPESDNEGPSFSHEILNIRKLPGDILFKMSHNVDPMCYIENSALLLASAFLTGVSAKPERLGADQNTGKEMQKEFSGRTNFGTGWGLPYLCSQIIDHFHGAIRYVTGNYRFEMRQGDEPYSYGVTISHHTQKSWYAEGNHLILDIPLDNRDT